jgi:hypothetical protein
MSTVHHRWTGFAGTWLLETLVWATDELDSVKLAHTKSRLSPREANAAATLMERVANVSPRRGDGRCSTLTALPVREATEVATT